ncbi:MAG: hypothetical protein IT406_00580 [Candidatus Yanofskybacteria bacterium]|nr:hypothetical protein [Candidatus Yanofskybacteria bacterium]
MTTIIPIPTPAVASTSAPQTSTSTGSAAEMAKCSRTGCGWSFEQGQGYVPELKKLYHDIRGTAVEKRRPLTRGEILRAEFCGHCKRLEAFRVFPTEGTIALMERWVQENKARDAQFRSQRSLERAIANQDRGINAILAEGHKERKHHKKLSRRQQREQAALKHRAPKPEEGKKKNKKGKGGDKQKGGKGKGKKK